jgi:aspartate/methionine/tyrosine aminotransferase
VARFHTNKRHVIINPDFVIAVDSAAYGILMTCKAFISKGDEAIVFNPVDFLFKYSVESCQGVAIPLAVPLSPEGMINIEALENAISPKTKMICLCNPFESNWESFL